MLWHNLANMWVQDIVNNVLQIIKEKFSLEATLLV